MKIGTNIMFHILFYLAFCTSLSTSQREATVEGNEVPIVRVKQGLIQGIAEKSLNGSKFFSYMGIPYAQPPEGNLRFKDPVPLTSWDGILNGTKMPASCLQILFFSTFNYEDGKDTSISGKEDCLHLNVFTPAQNEPERKLPVMVFIHGGAFVGGKAGDYHPNVLMNKEIVLVIIQYRLGIYGFLSTEDSVMRGNMGLKDQQLALKWVKENIESFGGDSGNITIFGESAGGASVHYHILSPGSNGLFNRAIIQSGTSLCPWASNMNHKKFAIETGREFNCSIDHGTEKYLECMQTVHPYYLTIAGAKTNNLGFGPLYVLPRVDGVFISEPPELLMRKRKYNKVDIIAGITKDEGGYEFLFDYIIPKRREIINKNFEKFGPISLMFENEENSSELTKKVYQLYLQRENFTTTDEDWLQISEIYSDRMFRVCHDTVANFFANDSDVKLYTYQLDHLGNFSLTSNIPGFNNRNLTMHGDDLIYLFYGGNFFKKKLEKEDDLKVREIFLNLWTNFAKTGNPTPSGSDFIWNEATTESFQYLSLTTSPAMKPDDFQKREFWSSLNTTQNKLLQDTLQEETGSL
ncbi:UNVERIFIED_CONTAM: hypothetical protein RMT77_002907 [Armadillidium vulgare]